MRFSTLKKKYFIFKVTPVGTPMDIATAKELCSDTLRSRPYSTTAPNVPALRQQKNHLEKSQMRILLNDSLERTSEPSVVLLKFMAIAKIEVRVRDTQDDVDLSSILISIPNQGRAHRTLSRGFIC